MEISSSTSSLFQTTSNRRPSPQERFEQTDADKSGTLSLDEFKAGAPKGENGSSNGVDQAELFTSMDTDSNGELTQAEMESAFQRMSDGTRGALIDAQAGGPPPGGPPPGGPPPGGAPGNKSSVSGSQDITSLLTSSTDSEEDEEEDDATSSLISQLRSAAASYGAGANMTGTTTGASIPGSLLA